MAMTSCPDRQRRGGGVSAAPPAVPQEIDALSIDLETYSDRDLKKCGVYKYAESPAFEVLLFGVSVNGGPVDVYDIYHGESPPDGILAALTDPGVTKWAFNANFERVCLSIWLRREYPQYFRGYGAPVDTVGGYLSPEGWKCSMVLAAYNGLPMTLEGVGAVLGLGEQKMKEGAALIRYFCVPCKPTNANGGRTRNLPDDAPEKWETFRVYNRRDVEVEMVVQHRLRKFPVPDSVWEEYWIDQEINDRGILIDLALVDNAIRIDQQCHADLMGRLREITGLENPGSVTQMRSWLAKHGVETDSLDKKAVAALLETAEGEVAEALQLRQQTAKSSVKKFQAMENAMCADGRIRGMFRFYGASRSGRFAGRIVQLQNLVRNSMPDLEQARELVKAGDYEMLDLLYDSVPQVLSELVRTALIPRPGMKFIVSDYSAVEARCLAFLAKEQWRLDAFADNQDIYCASASQMFKMPVEKHGVNGHLRQRGKIAELALGYGGGVGALKAMGALEMGLEESELQPLVDSWRAANPRITRFWKAVDEAVKLAVKEKITTRTHGFTFTCRSGMLFIELPSGRHLSYAKPQIGMNRFGGESVTYMGIGPTKKWERIESYGPKFVENVTQAVCRDILCYAMGTLQDCAIVAHVHDELIIECDENTPLEYICERMSRTPPWIPGLLLRADGYETNFYKKD